MSRNSWQARRFSYRRVGNMAYEVTRKEDGKVLGVVGRERDQSWWMTAAEGRDPRLTVSSRERAANLLNEQEMAR